MVKIDNDITKYMAKPFIIIAQRRAGGTFLSHCLSNHPQVFCDRAETVHHQSVWRRYARKLPTPQLVDMLTHQEGYNASGCKLVYTQAFESKMWQRIKQINPLIIHLTRKNKLRQAMSICFHQRVRKGKFPFYPIHSTNEIDKKVSVVKIDPKIIISTMEWLDRNEKRNFERIAKVNLNNLHITYTDMVGREGPTAKQMTKKASNSLCRFLNVQEMILSCGLRRVHSHALWDWLGNYQEVKAAVQQTKYAKFLRDEEIWSKKHTPQAKTS